MSNHLSDDQIQDLYAWIDEIPLSRPKRNISRDFSDGVAAAEVIKHFQPRIIDLHNYPVSSSRTQKLLNWNLLNQKCLKKLGYTLENELIHNLINAKNGYVETFLCELREKLDQSMRGGNGNRMDESHTSASSIKRIYEKLDPARAPSPPFSAFNKQHVGRKANPSDLPPLIIPFLDYPPPLQQIFNSHLDPIPSISQPTSPTSSHLTLNHRSPTRPPPSQHLLSQKTRHSFHQPQHSISHPFHTQHFPASTHSQLSTPEINHPDSMTHQSPPAIHSTDFESNELNRTIEMMQIKLMKMEQLMGLKDQRIHALELKLKQKTQK